MKSRIFRAGVVGYGRIAESAHVPAWSRLPFVDVVAVADTCPERRAAAAAALPDTRQYETCAEMLGAEALDVLDICTPPSDHTTSILAGCKANVSRIVCEKPLAASQAEYRAISSAQATSGSQVYTVNSWFQSDLHRLVSKVLKSGEIGRIKHIELRTLRPDCALGVPSWHPRWRTEPRYAGGGIVLDHGWHQLYLMANWIDADPVGVRAKLDTLLPKHAPVEDFAVLDLQFPAATGRIELSWAAPSRTNDGRIVGSRGTISIEDDRLLIEARGNIYAEPYGERLSDSSYHPEWFVALFGNVLNDTNRLEGSNNLREAGMLMTTLCQAYGRPADMLDRVAAASSTHVYAAVEMPPMAVGWS